MTSSTRLKTCLLCLALGGCLPLEQAPLVYSSKQVFGVNVAGGTPDSPGLDVAIGYKSLDAAFVPVAIAKRCGKSQGTGCAAVNYNITTVNGTNKLSGQSVLDDQLAKQYDDAIASARSTIKTASGALEDTRRQLAEIDTLGAKQARMTQLDLAEAASVSGRVDANGAPIAPVPFPSEQIQEKADLKITIARLQALDAKKLQMQGNLKTLQATIDDAAAEKGRNIEALQQLLARRDRRTGDDKDDALSVYGSFNGKASGEAKGAELALGQVFSTGIAAQNVSQGIKDSAHVDATRKCLAEAKLLAAGSTDVGLLTALAKSCGSETEQTD